MGISGGVGSHVDIRLKSAAAGSNFRSPYDINPLYHIQHAPPAYSLSIIQPLERGVLFHRPGQPETEQLNERVRLNVNSSIGTDLDRMKFYIFAEGTPPEQIIYDNTTSSASVVYGGLPPGLPDSDPLPSYIKTKGNDNRGSFTRTGVSPTGGMGHDDFYFIGFNTRINSSGMGDALLNSEAKFPDGEYVLAARAHSIRHSNTDVFFDTSTKIVLDNFRPYVKQVEVKKGAETVYIRAWALEGSMLRSYAPGAETPLVVGEYTVITTFSEPMFEASLVGVNNAFSPYSSVQISTLTIGAYTQDALLPLEIRGSDIAGAANSILAIEPGKPLIDPARELTRDASGYMQGDGGPDRFHSLRIEAAPPVIEYENRNNTLAYSCGGNTCGTETEPINLVWNQVHFKYHDIGAGIRDIIIYNAEGGVVRIFSYEPHVYAQEIRLDLPDGLYRQVVTDNSGHPTTMWFRVDPDSPRLNISAIDMSSDFNTFTASGTVRDTGSGLDFFRLSRGAALITDFGVTRGRTEPLNFTSPPLSVDSVYSPGEAYYVFSAQDKAGNMIPQQPQFQFFKMAGVAAEQTNAAASYISEVTASGEPCTIKITSTHNSFSVPVRYDLAVDSVTAYLHAASLEAQVVASPGRYFYGNLKVNVTPQICDEYGNCRGACLVSLAGHSVFGLQNGPAEAFVRNEVHPADGVKFRFEWNEITFFNLITDQYDKLTMESVVSPAAPNSYVVYPPGVNRSLRLKYEGAEYSSITIRTCGFPPGAAGNMKLYHYDDSGVGTDMQAVVDGDCVKGVTTTTSRFSVAAPLSMYDNAGPVVVFKVDDSIEKNGAVYISSSASVALDAEDRSSNTFALAGVASTYYLLDAAPAPKVYGGPFRLGEGEHIINYYAVDKIDNLGESRSARLRVDSTPPESALKLNGLPIASGATIYANTTDFITLEAADPVSNGVSSGLTTTYFLVDVSPEDCEYSEWAGGGINGMGSCENPYYAGPFSLPPGEHMIYYQSVDNVRNTEAGKSAFINVFSFGFKGSAQAWDSVLWTWNLKAGATAYQVFSSTGGAVSPVLAAGTSSYIQAGLAPNVRYSVYLRVYGETNLESAQSEAVTLANSPEAIEVFNFGQAASLVIGQPDFTTRTGGTTPNKLYSPRALSFDKTGALWVSDRQNHRVVRFSPPFTSDMTADLVIGQNNFYAGGYPEQGSASTLENPTSLDFDPGGNLWVQGGEGRILRYVPPFTNGMSANLAIGVDNFYTFGGGCARNRVSGGNWGQLAFDKNGALWFTDFNYHRVLRFSPPFTMGMYADMVIGQPNFTSCSPGSYPYMPADKNLNWPLAVKTDSKGNVWVADYGFNRVVKYAQPLYTGMPASTVLGQKSLFEKNIDATYRPSATSLNGPAGLEFDGQDNLYVVDAGDNRVLKYKPPFSNSMSAGLVIGQNDFNSVFNMNLQATFNFPLGVETSGFVATDENGRLWVSDSNNNRVLMFEPVRSGIFTGIGVSSFTVNWLANNNSANTLYFVEISPFDDFSSQVTASGYVSQNSFVFTNLPENSAYYVRVKAKNLDGLETAYKTLGFVKTKKNTEVVSVSTETINGNPEAVFTAYQPSGIVLLSTTSVTGAVVLAKAYADGLTLVSNLYKIGPEGTYAPPASITFYYSAQRLAGLGLQAGDIAVYEHFADLGWVRLPDQSLDTLNNRITAPVTRIASIFGIFGIVKDRLAPVTEFSVEGSSWSAGSLYISMRSSVSLSAFDPVAYGTSTGVAFTEFSTDLATPAFSRYSSSFVLPEGFQRIEFRSSDNAGNMEGTKSKSLIVDATPPLSEALLAGTTGQNSWYVSPVHVRFVSTDSLSGVGNLYYSINGSSFAVYASSFPVSTEGRHVLGFYSIDNVLNAENPGTAIFGIDRSTPRVSYSYKPPRNPEGWNNTPVDVVFTGTDAVSGIEYCSSSFTLAGEGRGTPVSGYCADYAGWTSTVSFSVNIDTTAPSLFYASEPPANQLGWNNTAVQVVFAGTDTVSGVEQCSSRTAAIEGAMQKVSGWCRDLAGNIGYSTATINIDRTPPAITISSPATGQIFVATRGKIYLGFGVLDNLDPAPAFSALLVQTEDKGSQRGGRPAVIAVTNGQSLEPLAIDDGMWRLMVNATDFADNISSASSGPFEVIHDVLPPMTALTAGTGSYQGPGQTLYVTGRTTFTLTSIDDLVAVADGTGLGVKVQRIEVRGEGLGLIRELSFENVNPIQGSAFVSTFRLDQETDGAYSLAYNSEDVLANAEKIKISTFMVDNTPPATELSITGARYTAPGDEKLYITGDSGIVLTSSDSLSNDTASGVMLTKYRLDGGNWQVYTGSFTITAEGLHTLEYYALDRVQNAETLKSVEIAVDNTPPASRLTSGPPKYELAGYTLVSAAARLALEAADPLSGGIASGLSGIYYSIDASPAVPYLAPFALPEGGTRTVRWWSVDNVRNAEPAQTAVYELDNEAPALKLDCPGESFSEICNIYNSTFTVYGTVSDKHLKSWRLEYAPGANAQGGYLPVSSGTLNIAGAAIGLLNPAGLAGPYTLRLSAADLVENAAARQVNIRIGRPSVQLSLGGHRLLNKPEAVAAGGEGRLYIADTNNDRLALYTSTGGFIRYYGGKDEDEDDDRRGKRNTAPRFNKPGAVAVAENNIYVSDTNNNRVVKLSTAGEVLLAIGGQVREDDDDDKKSSGTADPLRLKKPRGLAVDAAGDLYVADSGNSRVLKLDAAGKELMRIILPVIIKDARDDDDAREEDDDDEEAAAGPRGLALDGAGNIYITDPEGGRVLIYDAMGALLTEVKAFKRPYGIAVSPDAGCLLIADAKTGGVYKLDRNKAINLSFGAKARDNDDDEDDDELKNNPLSPEFNKPGLLAFGADGSLYLADTNNNRVVKLGLPVAAPLVIDGRKAGKSRASSALAVQGGPVAPLSGPDPAFRLGEVYVFPNPAKGGEAPVFHIETGLADSVKITIYTISGRAAHEQTLTGMPAELDDGNGLSYAYEYVWRGHIPSGVYLYNIETQKSGQKLKKTGKFGIVR